MRKYITFATLFLFPSFTLTVPVQDTEISNSNVDISLNTELTLNDDSVYSSNTTNKSKDYSGNGLSPELFQILLYTIDTLVKTYPEKYGKMSVLERNLIPNSVIKYFPLISPEQLDQIESIVDTLITEYETTHHMAATFYNPPRTEVIQKRYKIENEVKNKEYEENEFWRIQCSHYNQDNSCNKNDKSCSEQGFPKVPLQPDPWDSDYTFQFEANMNEMIDFFIKKQDQIITMPESYTPDFKAKIIKNFGSINEEQLKKVKETININLRKYRGNNCGSKKDKRDIILIPPEKYVASLYEESLDSLEKYFIDNRAVIHDSSLSDIQVLRERLIKENTKKFCHLQKRTYESAFDTVLYKTRPTKAVSDKALINIIRFFENNNDRYNGVTTDSVDFISTSLKMTIPNGVTEEKRTELIHVIEKPLEIYYSTAIEPEPVELRDPQPANKLRSRVFSRDETLENIFNTHIQKLYNTANSKVNNIKYATSLDEISQIRAEILDDVNKENNE